MIQPWIDHRFARGTRSLQKVLHRFNREVQNLRGVEELSVLLGGTLRSAVYATGVRLLGSAGSLPQAGGQPALDPELERLLIGHQPGDRPRGPRASDLPAAQRPGWPAPRRRAAALLVPLVHEGKLLGLVVLGEKTNLRAYTREDFLLSSGVRPLLTIALANATLYDRLQELNVSLEQRVSSAPGSSPTPTRSCASSTGSRPSSSPTSPTSCARR